MLGTTTPHSGSTEIYFRDVNPSAENLVILLHGWMHSSARWTSLMNALQFGYHVIAPDFPGFGRSPVSRSPRSRNSAIDDLTKVLARFLAQIEREQKIYAIVGHSLGGLVLLNCCKEGMNPPKKVFLCGVPTQTAGIKLAQWCSPIIGYSLAMLQRLPLSVSRPFIKLGALATVRSYSMVDSIIIEDALEADAIVAANILRNLGVYRTLSEIRSVKIEKCLIARGEHDRILPKRDALQMSQILGARYLEFKGASHTPQLETPEKFNSAVLGFLDLV